jgi:pilus assembly protein Flp/PilA
MKNYRAILHHLLRDESGQDLIEYALVAALIGLAAVTAVGTIGDDIANVFTSLNNSLSSVG